MCEETTTTEIFCQKVSEFKKVFKTFVRGAMKSGLFADVDENNMKTYNFKVGKVSFGKGKDFISITTASGDCAVTNKFVLYNDLTVAKRVYNKVDEELLNKLVEQFKKQKNVKAINITLANELVS
jgi:hypothetical protein